MTITHQMAGKRDNAIVYQKGKEREYTLRVCPSESEVLTGFVITFYRPTPCTILSRNELGPSLLKSVSQGSLISTWFQLLLDLFLEASSQIIRLIFHV